jgi:hypothetical protein
MTYTGKYVLTARVMLTGIFIINALQAERERWM